MSEELQENLKTYRLQLQQVEASLTTDPDNEDLKKLHHDLQEVIDLTVDLISGNTDPTTTDDIADSNNDIPGSSLPQKTWAVGDKCLAPFSEDGQYYAGVIEEMLENGACTITFEAYGNTDVTQVSVLRPLDSADGASKTGAEKPNKSKKDLLAEQREYKRKKNHKKAQRLRQLEEERETEKNKWLSFNAKTFSKTNKGKVKKSIFATTDQVQGKVGVGTCGMSGRPMTTYRGGDKWRK